MTITIWDEAMLMKLDALKYTYKDQTIQQLQLKLPKSITHSLQVKAAVIQYPSKTGNLR